MGQRSLSIHQPVRRCMGLLGSQRAGRASCSLEKHRYSALLETRDHFAILQRSVRPAGPPGSHHHAHTKFEARPRLTGARMGLDRRCRQSGEIRWNFGSPSLRGDLAGENQRARRQTVTGRSRGSNAL